LKALLRPGFFVPERKNINDLFIEMQNTNQHLALLIDQYGGFSGIVTMEDLLEEIVGNIEDEYDSDIPDIFQLDSGDFKARGKVSIKELNRMLHSNFDESSTSFDTLGGMLIHELGYIPSTNGTSVSVGAYTFTIEKISDNKIEFVSIS
jgi:putative hemolysin